MGLKILQINAVYGMGSTGKIVRDISDKLLEQGHESYVMWAISCRKDNSKVNLLRIGNTLDHKLHALLRRLDGGQGLHSKFATKQACKKILEIAPDVVHLHNLHSNYIHIPTLLDFLGKNDIPTLITMHDCWFVGGHCMHYLNHNCQKWISDCTDCPAVGSYWRKKVEKAFAQRKALFGKMNRLAVNGVSEWTTEAARKSILKSAKHIRCIYNFVDTTVYCPQENTSAILEKCGISADRKVIFGVSQSWSAEKGVDAFAMLADELADQADVVLVGADNGVPARKNLHCIGFTSSVEELVALYSAADVLVNASKAETFGLVTVEAMACGTPVVAYDNSGSSELITPETGILTEDGNKVALLNAVKKLLQQSKTVYADACRQHVCKNFEKDRQLQEYVDFYKEIIQQ